VSLVIIGLAKGRLFPFFYQYGNAAVQTAVVGENQRLIIKFTCQNSQSAPSQATSTSLEILGAVYGLADVTAKTRAAVDANGISIQASNQVFGDTWVGAGKTLVVAYRLFQGEPQLAIVVEGNTLVIPQLFIVKAAYGKGDVTETIKALVNQQGGRQLDTTASNSIFGDTWYGQGKSLVVFYQYGDANVQTAVVGEGQRLLIKYNSQNTQGTQSSAYGILGAAYGLADVTAKVRTLFAQKQPLHASNSVFGDSWVGAGKTLVIAYGTGRDSAKLVILEENQSITL